MRRKAGPRVRDRAARHRYGLVRCAGLHQAANLAGKSLIEAGASVGAGFHCRYYRGGLLRHVAKES